MALIYIVDKGKRMVYKYSLIDFIKTGNLNAASVRR